jgi:hypothetical protein
LLKVASAAIAVPTPDGERGDGFICTATITIKRVDNNSNVDGARVLITWTTLDAEPQFRYNTTVIAASGVATSVSEWITDDSLGCSYTIRRVTAAGYRPRSAPILRSKSFVA